MGANGSSQKYAKVGKGGKNGKREKLARKNEIEIEPPLTVSPNIARLAPPKRKPAPVKRRTTQKT